MATFAASPVSQARGRGHLRHKREAERSWLCLPCKGLRGGVGAGSARPPGTQELRQGNRSSWAGAVEHQGASEPREGLEGSPRPFRVSGWLADLNQATLVVTRSPPQSSVEKPQPQDARGRATPCSQFPGRFPGDSRLLTLRGVLTLPPLPSELLGVPSARPQNPRPHPHPGAPPRPAPLALHTARTIN